jgi:hypothetical protein
MRICHFEDLLFENSIDVNTIIHNIANKKYPVSIKWDGAPAFVTGNDHKGFFLAFKNGYFKKEPDLIRTFDEIAKKISDPDLMRIMSELFIAFSELRIPSVIHGDFLFDMYTIKQGYFTPNVVKYRLHSLDLLQDYALGVAIHTVDGRMSSFAPKVNANMLFVNIMPKITYEAKAFVANDAKGLPNSDKDMFKKYVNSRVRLGKFDLNLADLWAFAPENKKKFIANNQNNWTVLINTYNAMAKWKNGLLKSMLAIDSRAAPAYSNDHEGLVFDTGDKLVKMVNRLEFSTKNFNKDRTYGRESVS